MKIMIHSKDRIQLPYPTEQLCPQDKSHLVTHPTYLPPEDVKKKWEDCLKCIMPRGPSPPWGYTIMHEDKGELRAKYDTTPEHWQKEGTLGPCPHQLRTFNPVRPFEGRIARQLHPEPDVQTYEWPNPEHNKSYEAKPSFHDKEENRLWNGVKHLNVPQDHLDRYWRSKERVDMPKVVFKPDYPTKAKGPPNKIIDPVSGLQLMQQKWQKQYDQRQDLEAQNRWKLLQSITPARNVRLRNEKMDMQVDKSQPGTFYRHEGKYNRERGGLYKTSFDPYMLQYSMNKDQEKGSEICYTLDSHKEALNEPLELNTHMIDMIQKSRTLGSKGSVPQLCNQAAPHEVFDSYNKKVEVQKAYLQPAFHANIKTQEGETILLDTTYGGSYSVRKFLQENILPPEVRKEPYLLISNKNQTLANTKQATMQKRLNELPVKSPLVESQRPAELKAEAPLCVPKEWLNYPGIGLWNTNKPYVIEQRDMLSPSQKQDMHLMEAKQLESKESIPNYVERYPGTNHIDMSRKKDKRFDWEPGCGRPRPQSNLIEIINNYTKTEAHWKIHGKAPNTILKCLS